MSEAPPPGFTPAASRPELSGQYDRLVRIFAREKAWRPAMVDRVTPRPGQTIVDIGCGTGTLAIALKRRCPDARIVAIDPDPEILAIARGKADGLDIEWTQGLASEDRFAAGAVDATTCSLVLHQVPLETKREIVATMRRWCRPGGTIHITDYGRQRGAMRWLFRQTVQRGDGVEQTQPNADGILEELLAQPGLSLSQPDKRITTPCGTITLFSRSVGTI